MRFAMTHSADLTARRPDALPDLFLGALVFFSFLFYEIHIDAMGLRWAAIGVVVPCLVGLVLSKGRMEPLTPSLLAIALVFFFYISAALIIALYKSTIGIDVQDFVARATGQGVIFALIVIAFGKAEVETFLKFFAYGSFALAVVLIATFFGLLEPFYQKVSLRGAGWMFDPNYAAGVVGFGVVYFALNGRNRERLLLIPILVVALFLTFSKTGLLATLAGIFSAWILSAGAVKRFTALGVLSLILLSGVTLIELLAENIILLRITSGLNARGDYWLMALDYIAQRPLTGHSDNAPVEIARAFGRINASVHNTYIEAALLGGLIYGFGQAAVVGFGAFVSRKRPNLFGLLVFVIIVSNSFTVSVGSVGLLPLLLTVLIVAAARGRS